MKKIDILIANTNQAKLFELSKDKQDIRLQLLKQLEHPSSKLKNRELITDKPGHNNNSKNHTHGNLSSSNSPKTTETHKFAKYLSAAVIKKLTGEGHENLILITPAQFYGELNAHLKQAKQLQVNHIDKNLINLDENELLEFIKTNAIPI